MSALPRRDRRTGAAPRPRPAACGRRPLDVLAAQPLFKAVPEAELQRLAERSLCRRVGRGGLVFHEGEPSRGLYLVLEGRVRVYRANAEGAEQAILTAGAGTSLGEASLYDGGPYLASARALSAAHLLFVPLVEVQALYGRHPEVALRLVAELGSRLREMIRLVEQLSLRDVPTRVAAALLRFAREAGGATDGASFRLPRTQEELAAELGTTRESVSRGLRRLRSGGVIRQRGARITVLDPEGLARAAVGEAEAPADTRLR
jgi:CRP-like cAMP-binding protein